MNTLGSHPGAIVFRLSLMVIVIAILMGIFFTYLEETEKEVERASILQTKKIIDSTLAVVFATYAVNGRLGELGELDGANPFNFLAEFSLLPKSYVGVLEDDDAADQAPGWYYLEHRGLVAYVPRFLDGRVYFRVELNYEDTDGSGRFDYGTDRFRNLNFAPKQKQQH